MPICAVSDQKEMILLDEFKNYIHWSAKPVFLLPWTHYQILMRIQYVFNISVLTEKNKVNNRFSSFKKLQL